MKKKQYGKYDNVFPEKCNCILLSINEQVRDFA